MWHNEATPGHLLSTSRQQNLECFINQINMTEIQIKDTTANNKNFIIANQLKKTIY